MKQHFYIRILLMVLIVVWIGVIFGFSSKNGTQSSKSSGRVTKAVIAVCYPAYHSLSEEEQKEVFETINFLIRKVAHFTEYAILAVLITFFIMTFDKTGFSAIIATVAICAIFAASDELHQGFVAGRNPALRDVGIDSFGAFAGSSVMIIIHNRIVKYRNGGSYDIR